jgi:methylated-DNA-[protein]-cysteine S-methyltransferase
MSEIEEILAGRGVFTTAATGAAQRAALDRLHTTLIARARRDNLLDVAYRVVGSPVGDLLLAATPAGLVRVAYPNQDHDAVLAQLAGQVSPRVLRIPASLDAVARQLDEYFAGQRSAFDLSVDLRLAHGFRRRVLTVLSDIGYGHTMSYGQVAAVAGSPRAARAVGSACATNPVPIVIPCHRVIRGDGSAGPYAGGAGIKQALLSIEAGQRRAGPRARQTGPDGPLPSPAAGEQSGP